MKTAIITGITGQDGSYLSELLLEQGYDVYGIVRRSSSINTARINHLLLPEEKVKLIYGDLADGIDTIIHNVQPDLIFNLAAMSHVRVSFDVPVYTLDINTIGPARILESIHRLGLKDKTRYYQASSSEMFGSAFPPQNELTPFQPCSPYGCAKLAAYWLTKTYRDGYGLFASNGILFNHESPRRGETFVTQKIVRGAVRIKLGLQSDLTLGNLDAKRDWGHSKDYMRAIIAILEHHSPDDFVVATGEYYSVKDFVVKVFTALDLDWKQYVKYDAKYTRPKEVPALLGNPAKIKEILNWTPQITFEELVNEMIEVITTQEKENL